MIDSKFQNGIWSFFINEKVANYKYLLNISIFDFNN